jgi:hypothetical protein
MATNKLDFWWHENKPYVTCVECVIEIGRVGNLWLEVHPRRFEAEYLEPSYLQWWSSVKLERMITFR